MVAKHLRQFRSDLEIQTSFNPDSWLDLYRKQKQYLIQPGARYLKFI
jgi:hypothetical protein